MRPSIGAAARIDQQAAIERFGLGALVHGQRRIERRLGLPVGDELHRLEQPAPADVADIGMIAEALPTKSCVSRVSGLIDATEKALLANDALDRERGGASDRMRIVGLPMLERARATRHGVIDFARADHRADRLVAGAEPLPQGHDVGNDRRPARTTGTCRSCPIRTSLRRGSAGRHDDRKSRARA